MAGPAFDAIAAYKKSGTVPPKWIQTPSTLHLPDTAQAEYDKRKDMY